MKHPSKLQCASLIVPVVYDGRAISFERSSVGEKYTVTVTEDGRDGVMWWFSGGINQLRTGYAWGKAYDGNTGEKWYICHNKKKDIADFLLFVDANIFASNRPSGEEYTSLLEEACKRFTELVRADEEE